MAKHLNTSSKVTKQDKGKKHRTQIQIIFKYLKKRLVTSTMVSVATGIPQKSICRYKRMLEKSGLLKEIVKKPCKVTKFYAWYITCDNSRFDEADNNQLQLFKN